jgi:hypothetical protein
VVRSPFDVCADQILRLPATSTVGARFPIATGSTPRHCPAGADSRRLDYRTRSSRCIEAAGRSEKDGMEGAMPGTSNSGPTLRPI